MTYAKAVLCTLPDWYYLPVGFLNSDESLLNPRKSQPILTRTLAGISENEYFEICNHVVTTAPAPTADLGILPIWVCLPRRFMNLVNFF